MSWSRTVPECWSSLSKYWIISTESIWLSPSYIRTKISLCICSAFWSFYIFTANRTIWVWFSIICTEITLFPSSSYTISTSFSGCSTGWTSWWKRFTSPANLSSKCRKSWFSTCISKSSLTEIISRPLCLSKRVVGYPLLSCNPYHCFLSYILKGLNFDYLPSHIHKLRYPLSLQKYKGKLEQEHLLRLQVWSHRLQ